jgi:uncharacterized HhH-GPD family protein
MVVELYLTTEPEANAFVVEDPFALIVGMLLDQQIPMERAFRGPWELRNRLAAQSVDFDPCSVASLDPEALAVVVGAKPALHRFPRSMAQRISALAEALCANYGGRVSALWEGVDDAFELRQRLEALPGFGIEKASILLALLAKRFGIQPAHWREASTPFGEDGVFRSVADATSPEALERIRETKAAVKAAATSRRRAAP